MRDKAPNARGRQSGCFSRLMGCVLFFILAAALAVTLAWYFLGRTTPADSAWGRLPADSTWAVEVHDLRQVLHAILEHPSIPMLLESLAERHPAISGSKETRTRSLQFYDRWLRPFHNYILPNGLILGGMGDDADGIYLVFQPSPILRILLPSPDQGITIVDTDRGPFRKIFIGGRDGWIVTATSREIAAMVLDNWNNDVMPFGPPSELRGPHISLGIRPRGSQSAPLLGRDAPDHFMLGDPFTAPGDVVRSGGKPSMGARILFLPEPGAWRFQGEVLGNGADFPAGPELSIRTLRAGLAMREPSRHPRNPEVTMTVGLSPAIREHILGLLDASHFSREGDVDPRIALGWKWFRHAWLDTIGTDIFFFLEKASRYGSAPNPDESGAVDDVDADVPPIPQLAIGWTLREGLAPRLTGEAFTKALTTWLDAVKASSGTPLVRAVHNVIEYRVEEQGLEGVVLLAHVPASGARPAWKQTVGSALPMGWLASYPAGIHSALRRDPAFRDVRPAEGIGAKAVMEWHIDRELFTECAEWLQDRRLAIPDGGAKDHRMEAILDAASTILNLFPAGRVLTAYDAESGRLLFTGVMHGNVGKR